MIESEDGHVEWTTIFAFLSPLVGCQWLVLQEAYIKAPYHRQLDDLEIEYELKHVYGFRISPTPVDFELRISAVSNVVGLGKSDMLLWYRGVAKVFHDDLDRCNNKGLIWACASPRGYRRLMEPESLAVIPAVVTLYTAICDSLESLYKADHRVQRFFEVRGDYEQVQLDVV